MVSTAVQSMGPNVSVGVWSTNNVTYFGVGMATTHSKHKPMVLEGTLANGKHGGNVAPALAPIFCANGESGHNNSNNNGGGAESIADTPLEPDLEGDRGV